MKTRKYLVLKADTMTAIYRSTVVKLVSRGYSFSDAKNIVKKSTLLEDAKKYWSIPRDMGHREWADYALANEKQVEVRYGA